MNSEEKRKKSKKWDFRFSRKNHIKIHYENRIIFVLVNVCVESGFARGYLRSRTEYHDQETKVNEKPPHRRLFLCIIRVPFY